jgi:hypothetical protein
MNDTEIVTVTMTLTLGPLVMQAFPTPQAVRTYLQDVGVWPSGARDERWQLDVSAPGAYLVHLTCLVSLPDAAGS